MTKRRFLFIFLCIAVAVSIAHVLMSPKQPSTKPTDVTLEQRRRLQISGETETTITSSSSSPHPYSLQNPVLVLGLPRSGSLAVHQFFTCNSIKSSHYCCDKNKTGAAQPNTAFPCRDTTCGACIHRNVMLNANSKSPFQGCGDFKVYSQFAVETGDPYAWFLPQHYALPLLHQAHPSSAWILNRRGTSRQWVTNVLHWYSVTRRFMNAFGIEDDNANSASDNRILGSSNETVVLTEQSLAREIRKSHARIHNETAHEGRRQILEQVYERHLQKVRDTAAATGHPLVEINVDNVAVAGETLVTAFGLSLRADCFAFDAHALDNDWKDVSLTV